MIIKEENVRKIKIKSCGIILFIILLRDNRLALSFSSGIITILDPNNDYKCDIQIKEYKEPIYSFCEIVGDNTLAACSWERTLKLFKISKTSYSLLYAITKIHKNHKCQLLAILNNRILSTSEDCIIKIWKGDSPYSDMPIVVLFPKLKSQLQK